MNNSCTFETVLLITFLTSYHMSKTPLISPDLSLDAAWELVHQHLTRAVSRDGAREEHAFRYLSLATVDVQGCPRQRMVVLRAFRNQREFVIFTDSRSDKVAEITANSAVSLLFYDDRRGLQLRVNGAASLIVSGDDVVTEWSQRGSKSPFSYTSVLPPDTPITHPEEAYTWKDDDSAHFCLIRVEATLMEFLQLDGIRHRRSERSWIGDEVTSRWIAP